MLRANKLDADRASILVIDLQEKLLPFIGQRERVVASSRELIDGARVFHLPVIATEQYPKGIGPTEPSVLDALNKSGAKMLEKPTFSACDEPDVIEALRTIDRPQIIVIGIEAHVCVQQTTLDLCAMGYEAFVCADAIGSRGRLDYENALARMRQEGAYVTTVESVLFELCHRSGTPQFKEMLEVIKAAPIANE